MNILRFGLALSLACTAFTGFGQLPGLGGSGSGGSISDACTIEEYTIGACFACFGQQITQCGELPTDAQRDACLEGANSFYEWCLDQIDTTGNRLGLQMHTPIDHATPMDRRAGMRFEAKIPAARGVDSIAVYVLMHDGKTSELVRLDGHDFAAFALDDSANTFAVDIFEHDRFVTSETRGIVVATENLRGEKTSAFAFAAQTTDSYDLNNDGRFDQIDKLLAMQSHAARTLSRHEVLDILVAPVDTR